MTKTELQNLVIDYAQGIGFPPQIAVAQMVRESDNFRSDVVYGPFVGRAGERGLAQFIPGTWQQFGLGGDPYNPVDSLNAWAYYIGYLRGLFGEDYTKILQAYNGGPGNVQRGTVSPAAQRYAAEILAAAGQQPILGNGSITDIFAGEWDWKKWAAIGLIGLFVVVAFND